LPLSRAKGLPFVDVPIVIEQNRPSESLWIISSGFTAATGVIIWPDQLPMSYRLADALHPGLLHTYLRWRLACALFAALNAGWGVRLNAGWGVRMSCGVGPDIANSKFGGGSCPPFMKEEANFSKECASGCVAL